MSEEKMSEEKMSEKKHVSNVTPLNPELKKRIKELLDALPETRKDNKVTSIFGLPVSFVEDKEFKTKMVGVILNANSPASFILHAAAEFDSIEEIMCVTALHMNALLNE